MNARYISASSVTSAPRALRVRLQVGSLLRVLITGDIVHVGGQTQRLQIDTNAENRRKR